MKKGKTKRERGSVNKKKKKETDDDNDHEFLTNNITNYLFRSSYLLGAEYILISVRYS